MLSWRAIYIVTVVAVYSPEHSDEDTQRGCWIWVHNTHLHSWCHWGKCLTHISGIIKVNVLPAFLASSMWVFHPHSQQHQGACFTCITGNIKVRVSSALPATSRWVFHLHYQQHQGECFTCITGNITLSLWLPFLAASKIVFHLHSWSFQCECFTSTRPYFLYIYVKWVYIGVLRQIYVEKGHSRSKV